VKVGGSITHVYQSYGTGKHADNSKGRTHYGDTDVHGRVILKWILKK
jgi:hypothetical protein